ncbi:hypothetical protein K7X08_013731 [Anisodus acutangulus]|uniref:Protein kinase domain-containing protein n=1 Tax=Anisodus acutangulus TaxID=402998 RepID=A0A9Q1LPB4_9SOLA|nr:hypothetical protein K7X08_013731 [Anisodus acutangulus]
MNWLLNILFTLHFLISCITAQQEYSGNSVLNCNNKYETNYSCNGRNSTCQAFLIFRARNPYNSVPGIAALMSSDISEIARINNVMRLTFFSPEKEVVIPVNCSCSGLYYQAKTMYYIPAPIETYFMIANSTYQGLSTCNALERRNKYDEFSLRPGLELQVPLRCTCPTAKQAAKGSKYLMTYSIDTGDDILKVSKRFNASAKHIFEANGILDENSLCYIHKNINSRNILLDSNLRAKIANFNLAIETDTSGTTMEVVGTTGYMAPEYVETGSVTSKMDIYALGVVLLELVTGKDVVTVQESGEILLSVVVAAIMEGENAETELDRFIEKHLRENDDLGIAFQVANLSLRCLTREPSNRPSMEKIVSCLLKIQVNVHKAEETSKN